MQTENMSKIVKRLINRTKSCCLELTVTNFRCLKSLRKSFFQSLTSSSDKQSTFTNRLIFSIIFLLCVLTIGFGLFQTFMMFNLISLLLICLYLTKCYREEKSSELRKITQIQSLLTKLSEKDDDYEDELEIKRKESASTQEDSPVTDKDIRLPVFLNEKELKMNDIFFSLAKSKRTINKKVSEAYEKNDLLNSISSCSKSASPEQNTSKSNQFSSNGKSNLSTKKISKLTIDQVVNVVKLKMSKRIGSLDKEEAKTRFSPENGRFRIAFRQIKEITEGTNFLAEQILEQRKYLIKKKHFAQKKRENGRRANIMDDPTLMQGIVHPNIAKYVTSWIEKKEKSDQNEDLFKKKNLKNISTNLEQNFEKNKNHVVEESQVFEDADALLRVSPSSFLASSPIIGAGEEKNFEIHFEELDIQNSNELLQKNNMLKNDIPIEVSFQMNHKESHDLYTQFEFCEGVGLDALLQAKNIKLLSQEKFVLFDRILSAVEFLHAKKIAHRKISSENVIVTNDGVPKLIGFGAAVLCDDLSKESHKMDFDVQFTADCSKSSENELINENDEQFNMDVSGLGVLLFDLLSEFRTNHQRCIALQEIRKTKQVCSISSELSAIEIDLVQHLLNCKKERVSVCLIRSLPEFRLWKQRCGFLEE